MNKQQQPFSEMLILADCEIGDIISQLEFEIKQLGHKPGRMSIELVAWGHHGFASSWIVTVILKDAGAVTCNKPLLHEALNGVLSKITPPLDTMAVLGFVDRPLVAKL